MQHVALRDPIAAERTGVVAVVDLQYPTSNVGRMGGEELFDVVAIHRLTTVKPPVPAYRAQPAEAPEAHGPDRRPGGQVSEAAPRVAGEYASRQHPQRVDLSFSYRCSLHRVDPHSLLVSQRRKLVSTPPSTRLQTCNHCRLPRCRVTGVQGPGCFDSQVTA